MSVFSLSLLFTRPLLFSFSIPLSANFKRSLPLSDPPALLPPHLSPPPACVSIADAGAAALAGALGHWDDATAGARLQWLGVADNMIRVGTPLVEAARRHMTLQVWERERGRRWLGPGHGDESGKWMKWRVRS